MLQSLTKEFQLLRLAIMNKNFLLTTDYVKMKVFQMEYAYQSGSSTNAIQAKHHCQRDKNPQKKINKHHLNALSVKDIVKQVIA